MTRKPKTALLLSVNQSMLMKESRALGRTVARMELKLRARL